MSTQYHQLLDATIRHLEHLKTQGVRFVQVSPSALKALTQPLPAGARRVFLEQPPQQMRVESGLDSKNKSMRPQENSIAIKAPGPILQKPAEGELARPAAEAKAKAMASLRQRALNCVRCPHLVSSRQNVVFGVGDIHSTLMFIGEAPGADEDAQGEPFVGKAGQLLTRIIQAMGLTREAVYIANILKCRPDTPGQSSGNRKPTPEEMETCIPYLHEQIDLIRPQAIVALGATATDGLLGKTVGISKLRGQWQTYRAIPLMPTFHPSYLLRPENAGQKRKVWEDMLQVMEKLSLPISEKQRSFFLKG